LFGGEKMKIKKTIGIIAAGLILGLGAGCNEVAGKENKDVYGTVTGEYVYGTVIDEFGSIVDRQESNTAFGESTYGIQFINDHDGQKYTFDIIKGNRTLESLNYVIQPGTRIKIDQDNFNYRLKGNIGSIYDSQLEVLTENNKEISLDEK